MLRGRWLWGGLLIATVPWVCACYVYRPVTTAEPQAGTRLAFDLNDQGRAALVTSVGPEVARVEGALVSNTTGEYVIRVSDVLGLQGARTRWSGETVNLREEYVKRIREKKLSGRRTAFLVAGVLGTMVGLIARTNLLGIGGEGEGKGGGGPGENQ